MSVLALFKDIGRAGPWMAWKNDKGEVRMCVTGNLGVGYDTVVRGLVLGERRCEVR